MSNDKRVIPADQLAAETAESAALQETVAYYASTLRRELAEKILLKLIEIAPDAFTGGAWVIADEFLEAEESVTSEWQPIETAPKDGTRIHLGFEYLQGFDVIGHWFDGNWALADDVRLYGRPAPTHWRSLPRAPGLKSEARDSNS